MQYLIKHFIVDNVGFPPAFNLPSLGEIGMGLTLIPFTTVMGSGMGMRPEIILIRVKLMSLVQWLGVSMCYTDERSGTAAAMSP